MLIVVQHRLTDPASAFARGERLKRGEGAPADTRVLQFYPSQDGDLVTCLWEGSSVAAVQQYVDDTLGDTSVNVSYAVEGPLERPLKGKELGRIGLPRFSSNGL